MKTAVKPPHPVPRAQALGAAFFLRTAPPGAAFLAHTVKTAPRSRPRPCRTRTLPIGTRFRRGRRRGDTPALLFVPRCASFSPAPPWTLPCRPGLTPPPSLPLLRTCPPSAPVPPPRRALRGPPPLSPFSKRQEARASRRNIRAGRSGPLKSLRDARKRAPYVRRAKARGYLW